MNIDQVYNKLAAVERQVTECVIKLDALTTMVRGLSVVSQSQVEDLRTSLKEPSDKLSDALKESKL